MIKSILFGSASLLSIGIFSQSYWDKTKIGFTAGPKITIVDDQGSNQVTSYNFRDMGSFNLGVNMNTELSKRVSLSYGVQNNQLKLERKDQCVSCSEEISRTNELKYSYLTTPVNLQIKLYSDRLDIYTISGAEYNFLMISGGTYFDNSGSQYSINDNNDASNRSLVGIDLGIGIDYNLSYRGSFRLDVTYQKNLNNFSTTPSNGFSAINITPGIYYQF